MEAIGGFAIMSLTTALAVALGFIAFVLIRRGGQKNQPNKPYDTTANDLESLNDNKDKIDDYGVQIDRSRNQSDKQFDHFTTEKIDKTDNNLCTELILAVKPEDMKTLKDESQIFSAALAGLQIKLQDRLRFMDMIMSVTNHLPSDEQVVIASDTNVQIKVTKDEILARCQKCERMVPTANKDCEICGGTLNIVELHN